MKKEEIEKIIKNHELWIKGCFESERPTLKGLDLSYKDFSYYNLAGVNFEGSNLTGCNFEGCYLCCSNFTKSNLTDATFKKADLRMVCLKDANLTNVNFDGSIINFNGNYRIKCFIE